VNAVAAVRGEVGHEMGRAAVRIWQALKKAGDDVNVPFFPGRTDATQEMTHVESFSG